MRVVTCFLLALLFWQPSAMAGKRKKNRQVVADSTIAHVGKQVSWQQVKESPVLWSKYVMRVLDLRESQNSNALLSITNDAGFKITFGQLLAQLIHTHQVTPCDSSGSPVIVPDSILNLLAVNKPNGKPVVFKYVLYEKWEFDREKGKMIVTPQWIGPQNPYAVDERSRNGDTSKTEEREFWPMFVIPYSGLRGLLEHDTVVVEKKRSTEAISLLDFFESRMFSSRIIRVSNKDGKREDIFNGKHDVWVY
jgi:hypothetical protein